MNRPMVRLVWVLLLAVTLAACAGGIPGVDGGTNEPVALDVIFVPTDLAVVNAMLTLAGVTRDDIVYDLGGGDGRIVIAAAKELGARGVGVDLALFLSPELNARLRPKLVSELRPGTRIVSHRYGIPDWVSERSITVPVAERRNQVFLWRVPDRP